MRKRCPISCSTAKFSRGPRSPPVAAARCAAAGITLAIAAAAAADARDEPASRLVIITIMLPITSNGPAQWTGQWTGNAAALFPSARAQPLVERGKGLGWGRHQPAETLFDQHLDIVR